MEHAGKYRLVSTLGQGGMGAVYRALDTGTGREVALKRLVVKKERHADHFTALFQREYHTLAQLDHPSVIRVYDYGVDETGPFYTMELLAGDDLRAHVPLPYRQACALLHDIASSLSLLHARRLVHRDVTAGNVRVVSQEHAKLLDFGALVPMGPCEALVGTPAYVAPEAVMMQPLDGRADLYALGVLLYYALTRRVPYASRTIEGLRAAWLVTPPMLHDLVEVPRELSRLAASMIALDRSARPRDAAEVMERLASIGELERAEPIAIQRSYLSAPTLVGRGEALKRMRDRLIGMLRGGGGGGLMFDGPPGVGRSRMLDAGVLEAKVLGATVLRVSAKSAQPGNFGAVRSLLEQLREADRRGFDALVCERAEELRPLVVVNASGEVEIAELDASTANRAALVSAASKIFAAMTRRRAVVIAADDVHLFDDASAALLATLLADRASRVLVLSTVGAARGQQESLGVQRLAERSERASLEPLGSAAFRALVRSIFGDVPNVELLASRLYQLSQGNPRDGIAFAEYLVDRDLVRYRDGSWVLPSKLEQSALPASVVDALRQRLGGLSAAALALAETQVCSPRHRLSLDDFLRIGEDGDGIDATYAALDELVAADVLMMEGQGYLFRNEAWVAALVEGIAPARRAARHATLARLQAARGGEPLAHAYHRLLAGDETGALEMVEAFAESFTGNSLEVFASTDLDADQLGTLFSSMLEASKRLGRGMRLAGRLNYLILSLGVFVDAKWFVGLAPEVEEHLKRESGHLAWQALDPSLEPMARVLTALQEAQAAYDAAEPADRCYPPGDAIKQLVQYAVACIAVGVRVNDKPLLCTLPDLLEPFAVLTPIVDTIMHNCMATRASSEGDYERARELYLYVVERLSDQAASLLEHADEIRDAVHFGIANAESRMCIESATRWLEAIEHKPRHRSTSLRVRAVVAAQQGNWKAAAEYRRQAEQNDVESDDAQMFSNSSLFAELEVSARGLELGAVKHLLSVFEPLAERYPGWEPYMWRARAEYERLRGNPEAAVEAFERCMAGSLPLSEGQHPVESWYGAAAGRVETLLELGRFEEARALADASLEQPAGPTTGVRYHGLRRARALACARLGDYAEAERELDALVDERRALGSTGVELGVLYEARTLVAAWREDVPALRTHLELARAEYLRHPESGLANRYQRLRNALRQSPAAAVLGEELGSTHTGAQSGAHATDALVEEALSACRDGADRARHGLDLLCRQWEATEGYLYLVQASGLSLAAARPEGSDAPEGLHRVATSRFACEVSTYEQSTMTAMLTAEVDPEAPIGPPTFEHDGRHYHTVWVRARLGGEVVLVGLALVAKDEQTEVPPRLHELAGCLGTYLLRAGDAMTEGSTGGISVELRSAAASGETADVPVGKAAASS